MCVDQSGFDGADVEHYRHLVKHIQDAVVEFELVDSSPIIKNVNQSFEDIFGYEQESVHGESLNEWIVPEWLSEEATEFDTQTASGEINYRRVKRETASGLREFLYRGIPYETETDHPKGFAVYTDLTEVARNERRLEVMNRVLRHNLRNNANIISAHTTRLLSQVDRPDTDEVDYAATIEQAAYELEKLSQETEDIRQVLSSSETDDITVDCVPVIEKLVEEYRGKAPTARIETVLPESMKVKADSTLRFAIESLLENAIEHNTTADPRVRIRVSTAEADGWLVLAVDDNGPRIPEAERKVITDDAEITPTRHGSGLGLWLVKWTTESFGGEVSFSTSDLGGNCVRILLPQG